MCEDPVWDEYMSTGIDPTGGRLGEDIDLENGECLDEQGRDIYDDKDII